MERQANTPVATANAFDDAVASFLFHEVPQRSARDGVASASGTGAACSPAVPSRPVAAVTPSSARTTSTGSTRYAEGMARTRQQLAPRFLDYSEIDVTTPSVLPRATEASVVPANSTAVPVTPPQPANYYAVARGRRVGLYSSIAQVHEETKGYDYSVYRLCATRREAEQFIDHYFDVTQGRRGDPDPRHPSTLVAFCDGTPQSTRNWSHQTGVACIFPHNSAWDVVYTCLDVYCTAYRATAKAALAAIQRSNVENPGRDQVLYVYTRNQLLVRAMTEWMEKWLQTDWRKGDGHPVKNRDVLQSIVEAQGSRRVIWRLQDHWASEWTASAVSAAQDAAIDFDVYQLSQCA